jgi:hypothetical protein
MIEVTLVLSSQGAKLTLKKGDEVVESEQWKFDERPAPAEMRDLAECVFHDCYDLMNHAAHGST